MTRPPRRGAAHLVAWLCLWCAAAAPAVAQEAFRQAYMKAEQLRAGGEADTAAVRAAYAEAVERFLEIPTDAEAYAGWLPSGAFSAFQAADHSLAADLFARAIRLGRRDSFNVAYLLRSLWAAERFEEMLRSARSLEADFPDEVRSVLVRERALQDAILVGDRWLRRGETEAGLWVFGYAARAGSGQIHDLANLALAQRHVGAIAAAEATYRRALEQAPEDALLWNDLGLLYKGEARFEEAREALLRSRDFEPAGAAITNLVALAERQGRPVLPRPAIALGEVLAARPHKALARRLLLDQLGRRGRGHGKSARSPDTAARGR